MWKNKEMKWICTVAFLLMVLEYVLLKEMPMVLWKKLILLGILVVLILMFMTGSAYRYKKIRSYTEYLNQIQNGDYTVPLEENEEGELSILQNEIYKVTKRLVEQAELLSEKTNFLSDSLSNISHQLKTPVTSLLMMADLLQQSELPEEKRKLFTENMVTGLERMLWLVEGLLKLAKLDSGTIEMKRDMVRVSELVKEATKYLQVLAEERNITIRTEGDDQVTFTGDYGWSLEAVSNILKNCMEHTVEGGVITISYRFNSLSTSLVIRDNGEGIDKEDLHHIFERFYRGKNASSNSVGIGLALAKEIVSREKGTILVESQVGQGTKFHIKFYEQ